MNAKELLVHDRSQRQRAERFHASVVDPFGVFVLALELECEVVRQVSTFVVPPEQPEGVWVPDLERPKVKNTLEEYHQYQCCPARADH